MLEFLSSFAQATTEPGLTNRVERQNAFTLFAELFEFAGSNGSIANSSPEANQGTPPDQRSRLSASAKPGIEASDASFTLNSLWYIGVPALSVPPIPLDQALTGTGLATGCLPAAKDGPDPADGVLNCDEMEAQGNGKSSFIPDHSSVEIAGTDTQTPNAAAGCMISALPADQGKNVCSGESTGTVGKPVSGASTFIETSRRKQSTAGGSPRNDARIAVHLLSPLKEVGSPVFRGDSVLKISLHSPPLPHDAPVPVEDRQPLLGERIPRTEVRESAASAELTANAATLKLETLLSLDQPTPASSPAAGLTRKEGLPAVGSSGTRASAAQGAIGSPLRELSRMVSKMESQSSDQDEVLEAVEGQAFPTKVQIADPWAKAGERAGGITAEPERDVEAAVEYGPSIPPLDDCEEQSDEDVVRDGQAQEAGGYSIPPSPSRSQPVPASSFQALDGTTHTLARVSAEDRGTTVERDYSLSSPSLTSAEQAASPEVPASSRHCQREQGADSSLAPKLTGTAGVRTNGPSAVFGVRLDKIPVQVVSEDHLQDMHDGGRIPPPMESAPKQPEVILKGAELFSLTKSDRPRGEADSNRAAGQGLTESVGLNGSFLGKPADSPVMAVISEISSWDASQTGSVVWSRLDMSEPTESGQPEPVGAPLANIHLKAPGQERVSVRVMDSPAGVEIQVETQDREARQHLLGGLDELVNRVQELALGTVIEPSDPSSAGNQFARDRRGHPADWQDRRQKPRKSGEKFNLPGSSGWENRTPALT